MAAIDWEEVLGQKFTEAEAREASDFGEILVNHGVEPCDALKMFRVDDLTVGRRLYLVVKGTDDDVALMLFREPDARLIAAMKRRLENARIEQDGGIIR